MKNQLDARKSATSNPIAIRTTKIRSARLLRPLVAGRGAGALPVVTVVSVVTAVVENASVPDVDVSVDAVPVSAAGRGGAVAVLIGDGGGVVAVTGATVAVVAVTGRDTGAGGGAIVVADGGAAAATCVGGAAGFFAGNTL